MEICHSCHGQLFQGSTCGTFYTCPSLQWSAEPPLQKYEQDPSSEVLTASEFDFVQGLGQL